MLLYLGIRMCCYIRLIFIKIIICEIAGDRDWRLKHISLYFFLFFLNMFNFKYFNLIFFFVYLSTF